MNITNLDSGYIKFEVSGNKPGAGFLDIFDDTTIRVWGDIREVSEARYGSYVTSTGLKWGEITSVKVYLYIDAGQLSTVKCGKYNYRACVLREGVFDIIDSGDLLIKAQVGLDHTIRTSDSVQIISSWGSIDINWKDINVFWDEIVTENVIK